MESFPKSLFVVVIFLFLISCDKDNVTGNDVTDENIELVQVTIDLQWGFGGNFVRVMFDDTIYFHAKISDLGSFSGPDASFITFLPRGTNECEIYLTENFGIIGKPYNIYETDINLGNAEKYYMGITTQDSTFVINLLEEPFGYQ